MTNENSKEIKRVESAMHKIDEEIEEITEESKSFAMKVVEIVETIVEKALFNGRWLLAPLYLGLLLSLIPLVYKFCQAFMSLIHVMGDASLHSTTLDILELLDITLLGNLIIIVIFSGYENFVSKINIAETSIDRPSWMGKVDYSGLKIKLIGSLVAISVIEFLKDFMEAGEIDNTRETWRVALHLTFVISGVLFALMDYIADRRSLMEFQIEKASLETEKLRLEEAELRRQHATKGSNQHGN